MITRKNATKLKAGVWLNILWSDAPDEIVLLVCKPTLDTWHVYCPKRKTIDSICWTQIRSVHSKLVIPEV